MYSFENPYLRFTEHPLVTCEGAPAMDDPPQWDAAGGSRQVPPLKNGPKGLQSAPVTVGENSVDENPKLPGAQDHSDVGPTTTSSFDPTTRERVGSLEQRMPEVAAAAVTGARASHFPLQEHRHLLTPGQIVVSSNDSTAAVHKEGEPRPSSVVYESGNDNSLFAASTTAESRALFMESCRVAPPKGELEYSPAPGEDLPWDAELQRQFDILTDAQLEDAVSRLPPSSSSAPPPSQRQHQKPGSKQLNSHPANINIAPHTPSHLPLLPPPFLSVGRRKKKTLHLPRPWFTHGLMYQKGGNLTRS